MPKHMFDTGKIRIAPVGTTDALMLADDVSVTSTFEVQNVSFEGSFQNTDLSTAVASSRFPIDRAFSGGKAALSFKQSDMQTWLVTNLLGGTVQAGAIAGYTTYKVDSTSKPLEFKVMFEGRDTDGKKMLIILLVVTGNGFKTDFSQGQFAMPDIALEALDRGTPVYRIAFEN